MNCATQSTVVLFAIIRGLFERFRDHIAEDVIAKHAAEVLRMTTIGKELLQKIEELHDDDLDEFLKELGKP